MVASTSGRAFSSQSLVAYAIGFVISIVVLIIGFSTMSVPWLALGFWMAASLTVLVIDRAVGERTPRPGYAGENFGAIFQASTPALLLIAALGVGALLVGIFVR